MQNNFLPLIESYKSVIDSFKNRYDVQNGEAIAFKGSAIKASFENTPDGIGDALGTTGFCVSASQALLNDKIFQLNLEYRGAIAKLVSIDIKEQYYGYCYNGSQNKWHTAILIEDSGYNIIVDITCRQFGNNFINKDIWDFSTWQATFRSPLCKHIMSDSIDNPNNFSPTYSNKLINDDLANINLLNNLRNITSITDEERLILSDFFLTKINELNTKLIIGNISTIDYRYIDKINKLLMSIPFDSFDSGYSVLSFDTKAAAKNWLKLFLEGKGKLPMYMLVSKNTLQSCKLNGIDFEELNIAYKSSCSPNRTYVIFEFGNIYAINADWMENTEMILPFGIQLSYNPENIFNTGRNIVGNITPDNNLIKETNTIYLKVESQE